jgi:hypothetical protein
MDSIEKRPTPATYNQLQMAYDWFNVQLFGHALPNCLITLQRKSNAMGYYSPDRWTNAKGETTDEIALNPAYFANHSLKELLQTLVHEMCHQWQQHFGKPSRNGYHNKQWADKMESIGLMPSSTGEPGGARIGQHMGDYSITEGQFELQSHRLANNAFELPWVDRFVSYTPSSQDRLNHGLLPADSKPRDTLEMPIIDLIPELDVIVDSSPKHVTHKQKRKTTYECPECSARVWGKPKLAIACLDCNVAYQVV